MPASPQAKKTIRPLSRAVKPLPAVRGREEYEGMPIGTAASHHNWPNC